ncbi:MAG: CobW family GTP-binding protein [Minwuia sp.]|uniref:CobW family GTP-binding protein n=1 Tax=Minwuia sp. TaxID=2493630 RepID=UPI003A878D91
MPIPFTVIGGFLGAGKTTLLNHLLTQTEGVRYAVFVNDFGSLNIDKRLIRSHGGRTIALENGCICCSMADGLTQSLLALLSMDDPCDHIVIEASGVADPAPIADVAVLDPDLAPDGVVVLVDAADGIRWLEHEQVGDMVRKQIAAADLLVLNKLDVAEPDSVAALKARLDDLAPDAIRVETEHSRLPMPLAFSTVKAGGGQGHGHDHGPDFRTCTIEMPETWTRAELTAALQALPAGVLRAKGFVKLTGGGLHLVQMAGRRISITPADGDEPPALVLIGVGDMPDVI